MLKISADKIFLGDGNSLEDSVIIIDENGAILDINSIHIHDKSSVKFYQGYITPGFINTHCHLELSHMLGKADTGTGLLPFLSQVVKYRNISQETILESIKSHDEKMYESGIMAVGDISNKTDTALTKRQSKIKYYTFVEMFDFMNPDFTKGTIENYTSVFNDFEIKEGDKKAFVPHAPYTVSEELFQFITDKSTFTDTISIHNQETIHENELFLNGGGDFPAFYKSLNIPFDNFKPINKRSIHYALRQMSKLPKTLLVHNTTCNIEDIDFAHNWNGKNVYWATCPNANLYIENQLPNYKLFTDKEAKMTIGTDSLTSNWQLSISEEIKTILKYCSYLSFDQLIKWACLNGAEALGFDQDLGSIEKGKTPGLIHWEIKDKNIQTSTINRII